MKLISRFAVLSISLLVCVGCDQSTKAVAQDYLRGHASLSYLDNLFNLVYAENAGTMLGLGSELPESMRFYLFVLLVGAALIAAMVFVLFKSSLRFMTVIAISLVVGGGIGNLIDRLIHNGSVIDFMLIKLGSLESGIFNVADIAITLGVCLLFLSAVRSKDERTST